MFHQTGTDQQEAAVASRAAPARRWEPQPPVMVREEKETAAKVTEETAAMAAAESAAPVATSQAGRHRSPPWPARPP
jgi:hypothetical protein